MKVTQNVVAAAKAGGGYNEFYFTKSDGVTVAPKIAYSEMFEPWGWAVATGNYVDDMNAKIDDRKHYIQEEFSQMLMVYSVAEIFTALVQSFSGMYHTAQHTCQRLADIIQRTCHLPDFVRPS